MQVSKIEYATEKIAVFGNQNWITDMGNPSEHQPLLIKGRDFTKKSGQKQNK